MNDGDKLVSLMRGIHIEFTLKMTYYAVKFHGMYKFIFYIISDLQIF